MAVADLAAGGTEVTISVADDHVFGPLVVLGTDLADRAARLTPRTDVDADKLIGSVRGIHPAEPLRDGLLRVSRLPDDLPGVNVLHLSPAPAGPDRRPRVARPATVTPVELHDP